MILNIINSFSIIGICITFWYVHKSIDLVNGRLDLYKNNLEMKSNEILRIKIEIEKLRESKNDKETI
jgi:hypothetical protein